MFYSYHREVVFKESTHSDLGKEGHYMLKMYDEGMLTKRVQSRLSLLSA